MEQWKAEIQKGKSLLARHDAENAVKVFSHALENCPAADCNCFSKILFYLGVSLKKLGLINSALNLWVTAYRYKKNRLIKKMIERYSNGYGMLKQKTDELDDRQAFYAIQVMRYLEKKKCHTFSTEPEKDVVFELIKEHWKIILHSSILSERTINEKREYFHKVKIVFPFLNMPKVLGDTVLKVNFSESGIVHETIRCGCGSGLPFCMCCGRTPAVEEIINGIF
ncbi:MAG: hypothetical protein JW904_06785 [Spirochaetales bacterium]|nr:hypothetical protein [Spirochaetales bacterium]